MEMCILVSPDYFKLKLWGVEGRTKSIFFPDKNVVRQVWPCCFAPAVLAVLVLLQDKCHLPTVNPRSSGSCSPDSPGNS